MTFQPTSDRAAVYLLKAERLLNWGDQTLVELTRHGEESRLDDFERVLFGLLALTSSIHESLASCAKVAGHSPWREDLNSLRQTDGLLFYLWKARDSDIHDAIAKWEKAPTSFQIRIIDFKKAAPIVFRVGQRNDMPMLVLRAAFHLFGVYREADLVPLLQKRIYPSKAAQDAIGVQMRRIMESLRLLPFKTRVQGKEIEVPEPTSHLGEKNSFAADVAVFYALRFYRAKFEELKSMISASHTSAA